MCRSEQIKPVFYVNKSLVPIVCTEKNKMDALVLLILLNVEIVCYYVV